MDEERAKQSLTPWDSDDRNDTNNMGDSNQERSNHPMRQSMTPFHDPSAYGAMMGMGMGMMNPMQMQQFRQMMMQQQQQQQQQRQQGMRPATQRQTTLPPENQLPPDGYVCFKCGQPGHWIYYCPNVPKGQYVPRNANMGQRGANPAGMKNKRPFAELMCTLCKRMIRDATLVPCCGKSFCKECITNALDSSHTCPLCGKDGIESDKLIPNPSLTQIIENEEDRQRGVVSKPPVSNESQAVPPDLQSGTEDESIQDGNDDKHDEEPAEQGKLSPNQSGIPIQVFESEDRSTRKPKAMNLETMAQQGMSSHPMSHGGYGGPAPDMFGGPEMSFMGPPMYNMFNPEMGNMPPDMWMFNGMPNNSFMPYGGGMPFQRGNQSGRQRGRSSQPRDDGSVDDAHSDREVLDEDYSSDQGRRRGSYFSADGHNGHVSDGPSDRSPSRHRSPRPQDKGQQRSSSRSPSQSRSRQDRTDNRHYRPSSPSSQRRESSSHRSSSRARRERDRGQDHGRDREKSKDRDRERERDKDRGRDRDRDRDRAQQRDRDREREKSRTHERERDRKRHRSQSGERASRSEKSKERRHDESRHRDREKSRTSSHTRHSSSDYGRRSRR